MRVIALAALALATAADAATRVAVIEVGKSGTVRRTQSTDAETSSEGVASFWSALHGYGNKLQYAGMTVVPDLFFRPSDGVVIGLTNVDLDTMPFTNSLMMQEGDNGVVAHMDVPQTPCQHMLNHLQVLEEVDASSMVSTVEKHGREPGFSGVKMQVKSESAAQADAQVDVMVQTMMKLATESGTTIVLHLIVEEEEGAARRGLLARRLDENDNDGDNNNDGENNNNDDGQDASQQSYSGYYGYGYYNAYGEWVSPYKTMFQIQYFQIVLWTSIGLVFVVYYCLYLMVNMPLMADSLLFGESAKVGDE
jgi:hypothetical protein